MKLLGAKMLNSFSIKFAVMGTLFIKLLGGWGMELEVLLYLTAFDYLSGVLKAIYLKQLSSALGYRGIIKKMAMFLVIMVAVQVERVSGLEQSISLLALYFYISNEGVSILENISAIDVLPIPQKLKEILIQIRGE